MWSIAHCLLIFQHPDLTLSRSYPREGTPWKKGNLSVMYVCCHGSCPQIHTRRDLTGGRYDRAYWSQTKKARSSLYGNHGRQRLQRGCSCYTDECPLPGLRIHRIFRHGFPHSSTHPLSHQSLHSYIVETFMWGPVNYYTRGTNYYYCQVMFLNIWMAMKDRVHPMPQIVDVALEMKWWGGRK